MSYSIELIKSLGSTSGIRGLHQGRRHRHLTRAVKATMKPDVVVAGPTMTVRIEGRQVASVAVKDHPTGGVAFGAFNPAGSRGITYRSASLTALPHTA